MAKLCGRGHSTVQRIAEAEGIDSGYTAPQKANAARRDYALAGRLELGNAMFDAVEEMLGKAKTPGELKDLATTFGILTDKRRLDDGEATNRTENVDPSRRERFRKNLDELAERRRMAGKP